VASGVGLALLRLPWSMLLLNSAAALAVLVGAGFFSTLKGGPDLPVIAPILGHFGAYGAGIAFVGRRVRREKRFIRDAFARYVAPALVDELEADPGRLVLGGERREVTLLFSDIAGFTKLSEGMDAQALGRVLNDYFDGLCAIVIAHEGTIDKLIGDAVVAIFGAPVARADHAERAVACALEMDAFAERFRREQAALGVALGATRIGVHSGVATVGNFGGRDRFNYTALGDTVNTASRLEGANKALGTRICVSAATATRCPAMRFRPVADVIVKGKTEAVAVVEPVREADDDPGYGAAYAALRDGSADALTLFERLASLAPDDGLVAVHLARLRAGSRGTRIVLEEK
jgi:class 3 adenylate cyclase